MWKIFHFRLIRIKFLTIIFANKNNFFIENFYIIKCNLDELLLKITHKIKFYYIKEIYYKIKFSKIKKFKC